MPAMRDQLASPCRYQCHSPLILAIDDNPDVIAIITRESERMQGMRWSAR